MASKAGRKSDYETKIKPNLKAIAELVKKGFLQKEMMDIIGVKKTVWYRAKVEHEEFRDIIDNRLRLDAVEKLEAAALKEACGYDYKETKKIYEPSEPDNPLSPPRLIRMEIYEKHQAANPRLNQYLLQNWGKESGYTSDPVQQELRRDELEFRKAQRQPSEWDDDAGGV